MTLLDCRGLSYRYGARSPYVFEDLDWQCAPGVAFLLGPNGAGKSTLLNLIANVVDPQKGQILFDGVSPRQYGQTRSRWRRMVGWVPQEVRPVPGLTVAEQVAYVGWLKGLTRSDAERQAPEALERVGLAAKSHQRASTLSGGQTRRMGIACALVHGSRLIVMDEPTAGLDPGQRTRLRRVVQDMDDVLWVISTHQTEDLTLTATSVTVMNEGRMIWQGPPEQFLDQGGSGSSQERALTAYRALVGDED